MDINRLSKLFENTTVETMKIEELASWRLGENKSRLLLPPIQRSLVWRNDQIINYWDSLLRGFPPGMMMVHKATTHFNHDTNKGRNSEGDSISISDSDWQLLDGQQRMSVILLGLGEGQLKRSRKLWIDLKQGHTPANSGLKYHLRISSAGQPFGYRLDSPNQKFPLNKRKECWESWKANNGESCISKAMSTVNRAHLIDSEKAIPLSELYTCLQSHGRNIDKTVSAISLAVGAEETVVREVLVAFKQLLTCEIIIKKISHSIVKNEEEYIQLFKRLGQGGTPLAEDELTYSLLKQKYPNIHDQMRKIMSDGAGRFASEINLVLSALRVSKILSPWEGAKEQEIGARPNPVFVSGLEDKKGVKEKFLALISSETNAHNLNSALNAVREALTKGDHAGFPVMLLARLPKELVDVLILFALKNEQSGGLKNHAAELKSFVLFWLLFVKKSDKAATYVFHISQEEQWSFNLVEAKKLIRYFETEGLAYVIPREQDVEHLKKQVEERDVSEGNGRLRNWVEGFSNAIEVKGDWRPGEALRRLSTKRELIKRALMWAQRQYLTTEFKDYDPTSDRDEDLPVDLDHIVPHSLFGAHWKTQKNRFKENYQEIESFRHHRGVIGNSLGNFRWLSASENRTRQAERLTCSDESDSYLIDSISDWNEIIPEKTSDQKWGPEEVGEFQKLIDLRTLNIYKSILIEGGIKYLLAPSFEAGGRYTPMYNVTVSNETEKIA